MFKKQTERQPGGGRDYEPATKIKAEPPFNLGRDEWRRVKIGWSIVIALIVLCAIITAVFGWVGLGFFCAGIAAIAMIAFILFFITFLLIEGPDAW